MSDRVPEELRRARDHLLDLSARNRLLNYRPTRRTSIRIVDEMPVEVWRLLVADEKRLSFLARQEQECSDGTRGRQQRGGTLFSTEAEGEDDDTLFELPDADSALGDGRLPGRYTDLFLQTDLDGEDLQTNLLRIEQAARSALEERGVNYLFLALGFVVWRPSESSQDTCRAPVLLVPVGVERLSARRRFRLYALDDDPIINPCLAAKMQQFRLQMPPGPEEWQEFQVEEYLQAVHRVIRGTPGWQVTPDIYLGLFTFTKYLMYLDLDPTRWPDRHSLESQPLIRAMCGDRDVVTPDWHDLPELGDPDRQDPEETFEVQDADSSQLKAILAAKSGKSLVIEGPPGTGKSQTIANIIAECLAARQTVLFVSEKMAALEMVKRRLDQVGLGEFCVELHSAKANRRSFLEQLRKAWRPNRATSRDDGASRLLRLRQRLNDYVQALHEPFGPSGLTPYAAMGRVSAMRDVPDVFADMPGHETWDAEAFAGLREQVEQLGRQLALVHPVSEHPWRAARTTACTGQLQRTVAGLLKGLLAALDGASEAGRRLAGAVGVGAPSSLVDLNELLSASRLILESPEPARRLLDEPIWDEPTGELRGLLRKIKALVEGLKQVGDRYDAERVAEVDWRAMLARCTRYWASPARWFRWRYWSDKKTMKRARMGQYRPRFAEQVADLRQLARLQELWQELDECEEIGKKYFDDSWRGARSDWPRVIRLHNWLRQFRSAIRRNRIGGPGIDLAEAGADRHELEAIRARVEEHLRDWQTHLEALQKGVHLDTKLLVPRGIAIAPIDEVRRPLQAMMVGVESLFDWAQYQEALQECENSPLAAFVQKAMEADLKPALFPQAAEKQYMRLMAEDMIAERHVLRRFSGVNHEADRRAFAQADKEWVRGTGLRLQAKLAIDQPARDSGAAGSSQVGILLGEMNRKRRGRPIRRILLDAGEAIQTVAPCFMMSPLSLAHFIDPKGIRFDLVVFDEASQVEPSDALGAIARGEQLVLVGDQRQLPPTNFFRAMAGETAAEADQEGMASITDMESILDRGAAILPRLPLRWHYRSRHASLIAFSNSEFYDNELVVFPSCHTDTSEMGLMMMYESSDVYDRGRSQKSTAQARRVAQWVFDFAHRHPDKTVGVGAFSMAQQQAILDEIERMRQEDDSLEEFFDRNRAEPFFVKNLETIQGDERDVILLSIGYGRGKPGERVSMNFGPLNQEGGWRRLNVLVTRARDRCVVFSSIRAEDFDLQASQARGVRALRNYLHYAVSGRLPEIEVAGGEFGSDFERAVYNALRDRGVQAHRQVGCAGYAIDLAVVDPDLPGKYILGIECDGASYHSTACARDRDRLRQQVLEGLGWKIHRIWSTDWFRKPQEELHRVLNATRRTRAGHWCPHAEQASETAEAGPGPIDDAPAHDGDEPEELPEAMKALAGPYICYEGESAGTPEQFYIDPLDKIVEVLAEVVQVEGPIREDLAMRRAAGAWGLARVGSRIEERMRTALKLCRQKKTVVAGGGFLWPQGMATPPVRRRELVELRDIDLICLEEIGRAGWLMLLEQLGMNLPDLVSQTARLLGFGSVGARVTERIEEAIEAELACGRVTEEQGIFRAVV